jgi:pyroglutamyl-peptidase
MSARPTILLTGFGPYPGVPANASAVLVPRLANAARTLFPSHDVVSEILPTEWVGAPQRMRSLLDEVQATLVLHFGVSQDAAGFELELIGRNLRTSLQDAIGALPDSEHVIAAGPELLAATLPAERIMARLVRLGLPCRTSDNAGSYLCNAVLYHSLSAAHEAPEPYPAGFIHVPASLALQEEDAAVGPCAHPLDWRAATAGGLEIIAACLENTAQPRPVNTG